MFVVVGGGEGGGCVLSSPICQSLSCHLRLGGGGILFASITLSATPAGCPFLFPRQAERDLLGGGPLERRPSPSVFTRMAMAAAAVATLVRPAWVAAARAPGAAASGAWRPPLRRFLAAGEPSRRARRGGRGGGGPGREGGRLGRARPWRKALPGILNLSTARARAGSK